MTTSSKKIETETSENIDSSRCRRRVCLIYMDIFAREKNVIIIYRLHVDFQCLKNVLQQRKKEFLWNEMNMDLRRFFDCNVFNQPSHCIALNSTLFKNFSKFRNFLISFLCLYEIWWKPGMKIFGFFRFVFYFHLSWSSSRRRRHRRPSFV